MVRGGLKLDAEQTKSPALWHVVNDLSFGTRNIETLEIWMIDRKQILLQSTSEDAESRRVFIAVAYDGMPANKFFVSCLR